MANTSTDFSNNRIQYSEAQINNQFDLALRILDYRFPLSSVKPVEQQQGEISSMGDFFQKKIDNHAKFQKENQSILDSKVSKILPVGDTVNTAPASSAENKVAKDIDTFFQCLDKNEERIKRIAFLKRKSNRTLFEDKEIEILSGYLNRTRGRDGIQREDSIVCGIHLGKASISRFSEVGLLKLIYALKNVSDINSKKHLFAAAMAAHHDNSIIEVKDMWLYSFRYLRLKAFTAQQNLPDRDQLIDTVIAMRDKLLPKPDVTTAGAGTNTRTYKFKDVRQKMIDSYDEVLGVLNAPE